MLDLIYGIASFAIAAAAFWAMDSVKWAVAVGIISGRDDNTIAPKDNATRAEISSIIQRFCEKFNL